MLPAHTPQSHRRAHVTRLHKRRGHVGLLFVGALSVLAGMTDAIGFLATGDFVSFMSGNTTRLAVALGDGHGALAARLTLLILAFVVGNALGVIIARLTGKRAWPLLGLTALLLLGAGLCGLQAELLAMFSAIIAMGMLNAAVEEVNGLPIGLTYVTGALSRFGRGLGRWLLGERRSGWRAQLVPWGGMFFGAVLGGLLELHLGFAALLASSALAALLAVASLLIPRRWVQRYMAR
ncbi:YoaK family protein [Pseudomonas fontis]|uniref:YoaK family protein n=1 Tax=Pseudomonas fontis TaxID=2942633 RepID=A0ABT5NYB1_9PSED|nr:YoaK family protein [Pseudomonas fontis]MDD0977482.1 YoaK family protein [Pseudomonas fontis]MDD0993094.1 YoaK family protein [Pseudomonas fontis]